jgi:hypothetical protein
MVAVPTPLTATAADKLTAVNFNAGVQSVLSFLLDPPQCDCYNEAGVSLPDNTAKLIPWDTESRDTWGMHSTTTNPSQVAALYPGRYQIHIYVTLPFAGATYTQFDVNLRINSGGSATGGTSVRTFNMAPTNGTDSSPRQAAIPLSYIFAVGDYAEVFVTQTSGGSKTTLGAGLYSTGFQMRWVSIH